MESVYVGNLPPDIRIKDIDDFFKPFGKLVYIDVNHRSKPLHAFVQFDNARNAFNAVKYRHGYDYEGYTLQLRLMENEVRKRRDATPPPPPPLINRNTYRQRDNDGVFNNAYHSTNNAIGGNFSNSSNPSSYWSNSSRSNPQQTANHPSRMERLDIQQNNNDCGFNNVMGRNQSSTWNNSSQWSSNSRPDTQQRNNESGFNNSYGSSSNVMDGNFSKSSNYSSQWSHSSLPYKQDINQHSGMKRLDVQQQSTNYFAGNSANVSFSSRGYSNMQQYPNTNRLDMPRQNRDYSKRSDMLQQNMNYNNNSNWNSGDSNMGWDSVNYGNNYSDIGFNRDYNPNNDTHDKEGSLMSFTRGLNGSCCKWFHRYIREGFNPETARAKALEHKTVPKPKDGPNNSQIYNDPTNQALEVIGNTIVSMLATNPIDNSVGRNFEMPGPSSSRRIAKSDNHRSSKNIRSRTAETYLEPPRKIFSFQNQQWVRALKKLEAKGKLTPKDKQLKMQLKRKINDFKAYTKWRLDNRPPKMGIISRIEEDELFEQLRKQKRKCLLQAKKLGTADNHSSRSEERKRYRDLLDVGFTMVEVKSLARLPIEKLTPLISLKEQYNMATKQTAFIQEGEIDPKIPKIVVYQNDLRYFRRYKAECCHKRTIQIHHLSVKIRTALRKCIRRMNDYERQNNLLVTGGRFVKKILKDKVTTKAEEMRANPHKYDPSKAKKTTKNTKQAASPSAKLKKENTADKENKQQDKENMEVNDNEEMKANENKNKPSDAKKNTKNTKQVASPSAKLKKENKQDKENMEVDDNQEQDGENPNGGEENQKTAEQNEKK